MLWGKQEQQMKLREDGKIYTEEQKKKQPQIKWGGAEEDNPLSLIEQQVHFTHVQ